MKNRDDIVTIKTFSNELEAQVTKAYLESRGITSFIVKDDLGGMQTSFQVTLGVKLVVRALDEKEAKELLDSAERGAETF